MEYVGIRDVYDGERFVRCELYVGCNDRFFRMGGVGEQKEFVIFNPDKKRFEFEEIGNKNRK